MKSTDKQVSYYKCIVCQATCGNRTGAMPPGRMTWRVDKWEKLDGEDCKEGAIVIDYRFESGVIPGTSTHYRSDGRTAYIPNNKDGKMLLGMLIEAFKRKLTFMVGTSLTTGEKNVIVWAGIHHKTSQRGGPYGYPDKTYFDRVKAELKDRGITEKDVKSMPKESGSENVGIQSPKKSGGWRLW